MVYLDKFVTGFFPSLLTKEIEFVTTAAFLVSKSEVHLSMCFKQWLQELSVDTHAVAENKLLPLTLCPVKEGVKNAQCAAGNE